MATDYIKLKKSTFPQTANKANGGSTFNGEVFTFGPNVLFNRVTQVRVARGQKQERLWESSPNAGEPLSINEYTDHGGVITLTTPTTLIKVIYEIKVETEAEYLARAPEHEIKARQKLIGSMTNAFTGTVETSKLQNLIGNFSSFNAVGQISGGIQCITSSSKPTKDFTKRPMIGELQQGAVDGSADVTSTKTTELSSLYKSSTITSSPILTKKVFDQPSANAILNLFKVHTGASSDKIKAACKEVLPPELSAKVLEQADTSLDDADNGITLDSKVIKETRAEIKSKQKDVQEAAISVNLDGLVPQGGRSFANVFANVCAAVKNIKVETGGPIPVTIPNVPFGASLPKGVNLPPILPGLDDQTGKINFNTNTEKFVSKGERTPEVGITGAVNLSKANSLFNGYSTIGTYKFEFLESVDELENEFANSSRIKAENELNSILVIVIGWTNKFYGPPEKVNAEEIHTLTKLSDIETQINIKGTAKAAIAHLTNKTNTKLYGIQPHYVILTDGRIQRGRPLDEIRNFETCLYDLTGIEVTIVANEENPPNTKQVESLNTLLKHAYSKMSGLNVEAESELKDGNTGPGIDIQALRDKFGKTNSIDNIEDGGVGLNRKKLAYIVPKNLAKSTTSASTLSKTINPTKLVTEFERINVETGKIDPINFEESEKLMNSTISEISTNKTGITEEINAAFTKAKGSALKIKGDSKIAEIQSNLTKNISQLDKLGKDLNVANAKVAVEKLKNIF